MTRWLILGVNPGLRGLFFRSFSYAHLCSMLSAGRIDPSPESFFKAFEVSTRCPQSPNKGSQSTGNSKATSVMSNKHH